MMSIGEVAALLGISHRALRLYDRMGLVRPSAVSEAGYRRYDAAALSRLQALLFYKELGFALKDIEVLLRGSDQDIAAALKDHRQLLMLRRQQLDAMIALVNSSIGGEEMNKHKTKLKDIQEAKRRYADEARQRWGHTQAWQASQKQQRTDEQDLALAGESDAIFQAFADSRDLSPADPQVQVLVKRWQDFISAHHYPCSKEILAGLGQMYVGDERFTQNLDQFGEGTARLMSEAIAHYCQTA